MDASAWLVGLTLRSTLVLVVALGLESVLRSQAAAARHLVLTHWRGQAAADAALSALLPLVAAPARAPRWVEADGADGRPSRCSSGCGRAARVQRASRRGSRPRARRLRARARSPGRKSPDVASAGSVLFAVWLLGGAAALLGLARALRSEAASGHDASAFGALARHRRGDDAAPSV